MEDSGTIPTGEEWLFSGEFLPIRAGFGIAISAGMALILHRSTRQVVLALAASLTISLSADAQTRIDPDRNSFSPAQDVELGRRAAAEVRTSHNGVTLLEVRTQSARKPREASGGGASA